MDGSVACTDGGSPDEAAPTCIGATTPEHVDAGKLADALVAVGVVQSDKMVLLLFCGPSDRKCSLAFPPQGSRHPERGDGLDQWGFG